MSRSAWFVFFLALALCLHSLHAQTWTESTVYTFVAGDGGISDGVNLIQASDGNFYGTTDTGGTGSNGTVFRLTPSGSYTILYDFCTSGGTTCSDGANPEGGVIQGSDGNLYGTARAGGANSKGTAFRISLSGTFHLLYTFCSEGGTECTDGEFPQASLVQGSDGNLYGTTAHGNGGGTVFKLTTGGTLTTLKQFSSTSGYGPALGLVETSTAGTFFGASTGQFYTITSGGVFTDISFATCEPNCPSTVESTPVMGADGDFYFTSDDGGTKDNGEIFKTTLAGDITDLHSECTVTVDSNTCGDGENPQAGLVQGSDGNFYGTAQSGGSGSENQGVIYQVTSSGTFTTLYDFCPDGSPCGGSDPDQGLVQGSDGSLYGIANTVIFKLTASPALAPPVQLSLSKSSVTPGAAVTLTYTVYNANSTTLKTCFATESTGATGWSGAITGAATAKPVSLTAPSTAGTYTYGLTCGGMESGFATLTVAAAKTTPTVAISVTPAGLSVGQTATLKVTVTGSGATPTGTVKLTVGTTTLDTLTLSSGSASTSAPTSGLTPGTYPLLATYSGDSNYNSANSTDDVTLAAAPTTTTLTTTPSTVTPPADVTLKATVKRSASGTTGTPTGSVTFYYSTEALGTVTLSNGSASFTAPTTGLSAGTYGVTAKYTPDSADLASTSGVVNVTVE